VEKKVRPSPKPRRKEKGINKNNINPSHTRPFIVNEQLAKPLIVSYPQATRPTKRRITMHKLFIIFFISFAIILSSSCASMSQPKRSAYAGPDNIGAIKPEMLIGNWRHRQLNPIQGEDTQEVTSTYKANGTAVMNVKPKVAADNPMENIAMEMTGTWSIEGENIIMRLESMRETSGNKIASFMTGILGNMKKKLSGTANIYEASANRIVLVSTDGQAQELTRIP
jgi:hypothetical protein